MLDCVIVGINEDEFDLYAKGQKLFKNHSGSYEEVLSNSIFMDGQYYTSIELMNCLLTEVSSSEWNLNIFETPNLGVFYLTNFLRKRGLQTAFINHYNTGKEQLLKWIDKGVRCIAITTTFYVTDEPIIEIVRDIRSLDESIKIIVGGPRIYEIYTSYGKQKRNIAFKRINADYYIVESQGESALCELVTAIKNKTDSQQLIHNIVSQEDGIVSDCVQIKESNSLDDNFINWDLFDRDEYHSVIYMRTTRGCRYSCAYCTYPQFAGNYECSSLASIEGQMEQLKEKNVKYIIFIDDSFNIPPARLKAVCEMMIRNKYNFKWLSFFRCVKVHEELIALMKQSGCIGVYLGIESLNRSVLKNMRKADIDYVSCCSLFAKYNILTLGSFIVGFPGETKETIRETIQIFNEHPTTFYNPQLYYHSKLAPINDYAEDFEIHGQGYSWSHFSMNWKEAVYQKNYMIQNVKHSILLPLNSSGIWALPYLFENGITLEFFMEFSKAVSDIIREIVASGESKSKKQVMERLKQIDMSFLNNIKEVAYVEQAN